MKSRNYFTVFVCLFLCRIPICEAGQFINLGFEDANYSGDPRDMQSGGLVSDLLPGWRLFYGTNEQFGVGFNTHPDSGYFSSIYNRYLFPTIEGQYSFEVRNPLGGPSWVLEQQGDVPPGTRMLSYTGTLWTVEVNGDEVPPIVRPLNGGAISQVFYDFSEFAGKPVKLDFVSAIQSQDPFGQEASGALDSITFIVPEPLFVESDFNGDGASGRGI